MRAIGYVLPDGKITTVADKVQVTREDLGMEAPDPGPGPHCTCPPDATLPEHMRKCPVRRAFEAEQCNCPERYEARHKGPLHHLGICPIRLKEGDHMALPATDLRTPEARAVLYASQDAAGEVDWSGDEVADAELGIGKLLDLIADDPSRPGLEDTPARVVKAYREMTAGYDVDVEALLTRQFDEIDVDGMIVLRGVAFTSLCEHHLLSFVGEATVAYIPEPGSPVVGLSKLARLVDAFAMRLQVQERMTAEIALALAEHLSTLGTACVVTAKHSCMSCRGVRKPGAEMVTSRLTGVFKDDDKARAEFLRLAGV